MLPQELPEIDALRRAGVLDSDNVTLTPLSGGVSSDIHLVDDGRRRFVIKRALPKLRVKDEWWADTGRNGVEQSFLRLVGSMLPDAVPRLLHAAADEGFFAMEYLGEGYSTWKRSLLEGRFDTAVAERVGLILGRIHAGTWGRREIRDKFETTANFHQLRTDPYLLTTASRHPSLEAIFREEAARLESTREVLVHGDYSPKNLLVGGGRVVVLDAEVAWFGDPTFDVAFLLNHLWLKSVHRPDRAEALLRLGDVVWKAYANEVRAKSAATVESRLPRLLLMLLLARIDGKSPVEYLTCAAQHEFVRRFVAQKLMAPGLSLLTLKASWSDELRRSKASLTEQ